MNRQKLAQVFVTGLLSASLLTSVFAMEIPVKQSEHVIDGRHVIEKVYEVDPSIDPDTLIEDNFEQTGYMYTMTSIVKDVQTVKDEKEMSQDYEVTIQNSNENNARTEAIKGMPPYIQYDQDGYKGKLYPILSSLSCEESGRSTYSGYNTQTKTFTYDYNDDELVPKTSDGYSLSGVTWTDGAYGEDSSVPGQYKATATYRKPYSYSTVDGYKFKITYTGDVEYESDDLITYTITYTGTEIPPEPEPEPEPEPVVQTPPPTPTTAQKLFSKLTSDPDPENPGLVIYSYKLSAGKILGFAGLGLLGIGALLAAAGLVRGAVGSRVATYYRDEMSGEYILIKKMRFNRKKALITVDVLAAPSATHFRVVFGRKLAEKMRGRVVTVKAGTTIYKETLGAVAGATYVIDVELD